MLAHVAEFSSIEWDASEGVSTAGSLYPEGCLLVQVEFHRYLLQLRLARCPQGKGWLGRKLWKAKTFLSFCAGNTC